MDQGSMSHASSTGSSTMGRAATQTQEFESNLLPLIHSFSFRYPKIISVISVAVEFMQYLAFALNPRVVGSRLVWGIIYLFQLPFWDGVFTKGHVSYTTFVILYWVISAFIVALLLVFVLGLRWTLKVTRLVRVLRLQHILSLWLSILFIPSIQMFLASFVCQQSPSRLSYSNATSGHLLLFEHEPCDATLVKVHMGFSITFLVLWGALSYLFTMTLIPVDREDASVRRRSSTTVDFWLFIYRVGLCVSGMLLTTYGKDADQAIIVAVLSFCMAGLHCLCLPYYHRGMNSFWSVAFALIGWCALTMVIAEFTSKHSMAVYTTMTQQGAMYAILCCGAVLVGACFYVLSRLRYNRTTDDLFAHLTKKEFVGLTKNPFAVAALQRNLDLLPFPCNLPETDSFFSSLHYVATSILEEGLREEHAMRQAQESDLAAARGESYGTSSNAVDSDAGGATSEERSGHDLGGGDGGDRDGPSEDAGDPLSAASLLREAQRRQVVSPTISQALMPSDAEVSIRFLSEWQSRTETFPTPHMVCFASRVFHRFMLKYPRSGALVIAYISFLCDYAPSLPHMTLCLELIRRSCAELSLSLTERYLFYYFSLHVKEALGFRDGMHQAFAKRVRLMHQQVLLKNALVWRCLLEEQRSPTAMYTFTNALAHARWRCYQAYTGTLNTVADDAMLMRSMGQFFTDIYHFKTAGRLCEAVSEVVARLQQLRLEKNFHALTNGISDDAAQLASRESGMTRKAAAGNGEGTATGDASGGESDGEEMNPSMAVTNSDLGDHTSSNGDGSSRFSSSLGSSHTRLSSLCTSEGRSSQSKIRNSKKMSRQMAERVYSAVRTAYTELTAHMPWGMLTLSSVGSLLLVLGAIAMVSAVVMSQLKKWEQLQHTMEDLSHTQSFCYAVLTQTMQAARLLPLDAAVGLTTEEEEYLQGNITYIHALIDTTQAAHNEIFYGPNRVGYSALLRSLTGFSQFFHFYMGPSQYEQVRVSFLTHIPMMLASARRAADYLAETPTREIFFGSVELSSLSSNIMNTLAPSFEHAEQGIMTATQTMSDTSIILSVVIAAVALALIAIPAFLMLYNYRRAASIITKELMLFYLIPRESVERLASEAQRQLDTFTTMLSAVSNRTMGANRNAAGDFDTMDDPGAPVPVVLPSGTGPTAETGMPVGPKAIGSRGGPAAPSNASAAGSRLSSSLRGGGGAAMYGRAGDVFDEDDEVRRPISPEAMAKSFGKPTTATTTAAVPSLSGLAAGTSEDSRGARGSLASGGAGGAAASPNGKLSSAHGKPVSVRLLSQLLARARFDVTQGATFTMRPGSATQTYDGSSTSAGRPAPGTRASSAGNSRRRAGGVGDGSGSNSDDDAGSTHSRRSASSPIYVDGVRFRNSARGDSANVRREKVVNAKLRELLEEGAAGSPQGGRPRSGGSGTSTPLSRPSSRGAGAALGSPRGVPPRAMSGGTAFAEGDANEVPGLPTVMAIHGPNLRTGPHVGDRFSASDSGMNASFSAADSRTPPHQPGHSLHPPTHDHRREGVWESSASSRTAASESDSTSSGSSDSEGGDLKLLNVFDYHEVVNGDAFDGLFSSAALRTSSQSDADDLSEDHWANPHSPRGRGALALADAHDDPHGKPLSHKARKRHRKAQREAKMERVAEARKKAKNIGFMSANYELAKKILEGNANASGTTTARNLSTASSAAAEETGKLRRLGPSLVVSFVFAIVGVALTVAGLSAHVEVDRFVNTTSGRMHCLHNMGNITMLAHMHTGRYVTSAQFSDYYLASEFMVEAKRVIRECRSELNATTFFAAQESLSTMQLIGMALVARNAMDAAATNAATVNAYPLVATFTWSAPVKTTRAVEKLHPFMTPSELEAWVPYRDSATDYALDPVNRKALAISTILGPFGLATMESVAAEYADLSNEITNLFDRTLSKLYRHFLTMQILAIVCWAAAFAGASVYLYLVIFPPSTSAAAAAAGGGAGGSAALVPLGAGAGGAPPPLTGASAANGVLEEDQKSYTALSLTLLFAFLICTLTGIIIASVSTSEVAALVKNFHAWIDSTGVLTVSPWEWHRVLMYSLSYPFVNYERSVSNMINATSTLFLQTADRPLIPQPTELNPYVHTTEYTAMSYAKSLYTHYAWLAMVCAVWGRERTSIFSQFPEIAYVRWDMSTNKEGEVFQQYKRLYPLDTYLSTFEQDVTDMAAAGTPEKTLSIAQGFMNSNLVQDLADRALYAQDAVLKKLRDGFTETIDSDRTKASKTKWAQLAFLLAAFAALLVLIVSLAVATIRAFSRTVEERIIFQTAFQRRSNHVIWAFSFIFLVLLVDCVVCIAFSIKSVQLTQVALKVLTIRHSPIVVTATAAGMAAKTDYAVFEDGRKKLKVALDSIPSAVREAYYSSRAAVRMRAHRSTYLYGGEGPFADYSAASSSVLRPSTCVDPTSAAAEGNQQPYRIQTDVYYDVLRALTTLPTVTTLRPGSLYPYLDDALSRLGTIQYRTYADTSTALQFMRQEQDAYFAASAVLLVVAFIAAVLVYAFCLRRIETDIRQQSIGSKMLLLGIPPDILNTVPEINEFYDPEAGSSNDQIKKRMQQSERLLQNILPLNISRRLKNGERVIADAHSRVTVVFAALVGMDEYSHKLSGTQLVQFMNGLVVAFDHIVDLLDLEKIKLVGDIYFFCGGLTRKAERDHAIRCLEASLFFFQALEDHNSRHGTPNIKLKVGINTGPVVAGVIGNKKVAYDLWGDCVNTASRMYSTGEPGRVQVSDSTYEQVSKYYAFEDQHVQAKGKGTLLTHLYVDRLRSTPYTELNWRVSN